jgi:hypothetical protein
LVETPLENPGKVSLLGSSPEESHSNQETIGDKGRKDVLPIMRRKKIDTISNPTQQGPLFAFLRL